MCEFANDSDLDETLVPSETIDLGMEGSSTLLPGKSKKSYEKAYDKFMIWRMDNNMKSFSENVLLTYFKAMAKKFKASTLWTEFSMLKSTLMINHQINMAAYMKLNAFLKDLSKGYKGKQSKTFLPHEIEEFLEKAPNQLYLSTKVALIFGIVGACRRHELHELKFSDVKDLDTAILVNITNSNPRKDRMFTVKGKFYELSKRYMNLRPSPCETPNFFLRYSNGQCNAQNVGINSFGNMGKTIATYLNLPDPDAYTGHCFRRTSETISIGAGDIALLEKYERLKGITFVIPERRTDDARPETRAVSSLKGPVPVECTVTNQNSVQADADWFSGELPNIDGAGWRDLEPQQLVISVKTERTHNPSDLDPLSDNSQIIDDSDESKSFTDHTDTAHVHIKMEEIEADVGTANGECNGSGPAHQTKTKTEEHKRHNETEGPCPASHTRLLEAILSCVSRQERAATRAARAQAAQARALNRIAQLLERRTRR